MPLNCSIPTVPDCSSTIGRKTRHSQGQDPLPLDNSGSSYERRFTLKTLLPHETGEHSRGCSQLAPDTPWRTRRPSRSHFSLHMSKNEPLPVSTGMAVLPAIVKEQETKGIPGHHFRSRGNKFPLPRHHKPKACGGGERDRTDDLLLAKQALSQLSYTPVTSANSASFGCRAFRGMPCIPLSASRSRSATARWWAREDLNLRPHAYQARALTS
jgi:hypothetical protein